jgi:hypothetical protein
MKIVRYSSFVLLGLNLAIGFALAFATPPFQIPDENVHWIIANHRFDHPLTPDSESCSPLYSLHAHFEYQRLAFHPEQNIRAETFEKAGSMGPSCFRRSIYPLYGTLLTYPGVAIARILLPGPATGDRLLQLFYLSRLFQGLLVVAALAYLGWRVSDGGIPTGYLALSALSLLPLALQQSWAVSSSPIIWISSLFLLGAVFSPPGRKALLGFELFVIALGVTTHPPLIALLLPLALSASALQRRPVRRGLWIGFILLTCLGAYLALSDTATFERPLNHSNPSEQIAFLKQETFSAALIVLKDTLQKLRFWSVANGALGWLDNPPGGSVVGLWSSLAYFALVLELLLVLATFRRVKWRQAPWSAASFLLAWSGSLAMGFLITLALYIGFSAPRDAAVSGLQPRYFLIPLAALLFAGLRATERMGAERRSSTPEPVLAKHVSATIAGLAFALIGLLFGAALITDILARYY